MQPAVPAGTSDVPRMKQEVRFIHIQFIISSRRIHAYASTYSLLRWTLSRYARRRTSERPRLPPRLYPRSLRQRRGHIPNPLLLHPQPSAVVVNKTRQATPTPTLATCAISCENINQSVKISGRELSNSSISGQRQTDKALHSKWTAVCALYFSVNALA